MKKLLETIKYNLPTNQEWKAFFNRYNVASILGCGFMIYGCLLVLHGMATDIEPINFWLFSILSFCFIGVAFAWCVVLWVLIQDDVHKLIYQVQSRKVNLSKLITVNYLQSYKNIVDKRYLKDSK